MRERLVIIGAGMFQKPLIEKAKEREMETHVFAWKEGAVGATLADYFYPVSIVDKEAILSEARNIKPDGVLSIASDLAMPTVAYVASELGLNTNSQEVVAVATNKYKSRLCFANAGLPSPAFQILSKCENLEAVAEAIGFPLIVKPTDRSGSRGIFKVETHAQLEPAVKRAMKESLEGTVIVEEFIEGSEYSVEMISYNGVHHFLAITEKETTGAPKFIESGQWQPAKLDDDIIQKIVVTVNQALTALEIQHGASHSEVKIRPDNEIRIIEIGPRMGGDFIGSHLVPLSTGIDFVSLTIDVALGVEPIINQEKFKKAAAVKFFFADPGIVTEVNHNMFQSPYVKESSIDVRVGDTIGEINSSGERIGYCIATGKTIIECVNNMEEATKDVKIETKAQ